MISTWLHPIIKIGTRRKFSKFNKFIQSGFKVSVRVMEIGDFIFCCSQLLFCDDQFSDLLCANLNKWTNERMGFGSVVHYNISIIYCFLSSHCGCCHCHDRLLCSIIVVASRRPPIRSFVCEMCIIIRLVEPLAIGECVCVCNNALNTPINQKHL